MSLRILYVITTLDVGGAEKHLRWLAEGLVARGCDVEVVYLKGQGRLRPDFERIGARVAKIAFESAAALPRCVSELARRIRHGNYDVVHTHLLKADAIGSLACARARHRALVASKHNEEQVLKRGVVSLAHGILTRRARRVIALSDHVARYVEAVGRVPREKIRRIYYGIDPTPFERGDRGSTRRALGLPDGLHTALCVARFHPQKDHETLFRAVRELADRGVDLRLLLAGGDPFFDHERRLRNLVRELRVDDRVGFLGIRDDVPDLLAASDLFVLPSRFEGLGLVYLEAMAASRPVLATDGSAIPEVVEDGVTGFLVPVGDHRALADRWESLVREPELARDMGRAGRARVARRFALPRMIDETEAVYREVV